MDAAGVASVGIGPAVRQVVTSGTRRDVLIDAGVIGGAVELAVDFIKMGAAVGIAAGLDVIITAKGWSGVEIPQFEAGVGQQIGGGQLSD